MQGADYCTMLSGDLKLSIFTAKELAINRVLNFVAENNVILYYCIITDSQYALQQKIGVSFIVQKVADLDV